MDRRAPYAAGLFYLGYEEGLRREVKKHIANAPEREALIRAKGIVVPHAGYDYSGPVAGSVFGSIEKPMRTIILGPNHSGFGLSVSIEEAGAWKTPLGEVDIDKDLANSLLEADKEIKVNYDAHRMEHSIEVQLPFLQVLTDNNFTFVPISLKWQSDLDAYRRIGAAIGEAIKTTGEDVLVIASSDFTHYEPQVVAETMDKMAIDAILALDPERLLKTVYENDISMCGVGPVATMLHAVKVLSATHAELIKYATSADFSHDSTSVVGYGGLVVS